MGSVHHTTLSIPFAGFTVTDSFKAVARLSTPLKSKPSKTNMLGRQQSETKISTSDIIDSKDKTINNNKISGTKQKTSNGLINKLKRARLVT